MCQSQMDLSKLKDPEPEEFEVPPTPKEGDEIEEYLFSLKFKKSSQDKTQSKEITTSESNSQKKVELSDVLNQIKTIK